MKNSYFSKQYKFFITLTVLLFGLNHATADETSASPFMEKTVGQEDFIYVWTLGVEGLGDG